MNKLQEMIKIADIHADRIKMTLDELHSVVPFDQEKVLGITKQELLLIELLTSRFAKLQDLLRDKIINQFLLSKEEFIDNLTILDKINKLERLEIIESLELWKEMREARNHTSHEYPNDPELTADYINKIIELSPKLLNILNQIKNKSDV